MRRADLSVGPGFIFIPSYSLEGDDFTLDFPFHEWRSRPLGHFPQRPFVLDIMQNCFPCCLEFAII